MSRFSVAFDSRFGLRSGQSDYRIHDQTQPQPLKAIHKTTYGAEGSVIMVVFYAMIGSQIEEPIAEVVELVDTPS